MSAPESPPPGRNRIRNTSEVLRKLSLNAEKNWHQNSGAKRGDNSSGGISTRSRTTVGAGYSSKRAAPPGRPGQHATLLLSLQARSPAVGFVAGFHNDSRHA